MQPSGGKRKKVYCPQKETLLYSVGRSVWLRPGSNHEVISGAPDNDEDHSRPLIRTHALTHNRPLYNTGAFLDPDWTRKLYSGRPYNRLTTTAQDVAGAPSFHRSVHNSLLEWVRKPRKQGVPPLQKPRRLSSPEPTRHHPQNSTRHHQ